MITDFGRTPNRDTFGIPMSRQYESFGDYRSVSFVVKADPPADPTLQGEAL